jgi:hypothetical protein
MQYFNEILQQPTDRLDVPDLRAIAKDCSQQDILALCKLTIAAAVQSDRKKEVIEKIQKLSEDDQGQLMKAIEQVTPLRGYSRIVRLTSLKSQIDTFEDESATKCSDPPIIDN